MIVCLSLTFLVGKLARESQLVEVGEPLARDAGQQEA